jgi:CheY-like chemotaxis protein
VEWIESLVVLVVEDEPLVRMLGSEVLTEAGFRVIEAANATEALVLLEARPDILAVISDVELSGENGFELARTIRRRWPRLGVVLTSGRAAPVPGDMPTNAVFLPKPYPLSALVDQVRAMAGRAAASTVIVGADSDAAGPAEPEAPASNVVQLRGSAQ